MDWSKYPNFSESEFACPCCKRSPMQESFIKLLQDARIIAGVGFSITSGFRCSKRNSEVGGTPSSSHLRGYAADIATPNSKVRFAILRAAILVGFKRIGIAKTFIHLDNEGDLPQEVNWLY